jgi:hypothetical protein
MSMIKKSISLVGITLVLSLTGCVYYSHSSSSSASSIKKEAYYPQQPIDTQRERAGSLFGKGGLEVFNNWWFEINK